MKKPWILVVDDEPTVLRALRVALEAQDYVVTAVLSGEDALARITNGAYREHATEWSIGEAAGSLAVFSLARKQPPRAVRADKDLLGVDIPVPASIDYYGMIDASGPRPPRIGDSVVFGFRPQAFVTRAYVVGVSGLAGGKPVVEAISDSWGRKADWPN